MAAAQSDRATGKKEMYPVKCMNDSLFRRESDKARQKCIEERGRPLFLKKMVLV